ncbi:MAG: class I SAM-dependent methyltransferase [Rhodospirillales bacterium]|nr:class I SAM-dependent methyltransferase [Rhodospirillales bacterium]
MADVRILADLSPVDSCMQLMEILGQRGYARSVATRRPVAADDTPLPWFSYPAIDYLEGIDLSQCDLFEFGCGNSTLYWARRCRSVTGVEADRGWYDTLAGALPANAALHLAEDAEAYRQAVAVSGRRWDVIVIDGDMGTRLTLAEAALPWLAEDGFIILDNADCHQGAAAVLRGAGLLQVDMNGFAPVNAFEQCTSFFFTGNCRPRPRDDRQPRKSGWGLMYGDI